MESPAKPTINLFSESLENINHECFNIEPGAPEEITFIPDVLFTNHLVNSPNSNFGEMSDAFTHIDNFEKFMKMQTEEKKWEGPQVDGPSLVLSRISDVSDSEYHYGINFTEDMDNLIQQLEEYHGCKSEIEILIINDCKSQNDEIKIKYKVIEHGYDINRNIFEIDSFIYNLMKSKKNTYINPFYTINEVNEEIYTERQISINEHTVADDFLNDFEINDLESNDFEINDLEYLRNCL